jgi:methylene-fatty-acyl-phospholipid synthase
MEKKPNDIKKKDIYSTLNRAKVFLQRLFPEFKNMNHQIFFSIVLILLCPLVWNIYARLEYYTHAISNLFQGNAEKGILFIAVLITVFSNYRNLYYLVIIIRANIKKFNLINKIDIILKKNSNFFRVLGVILFVLGLVLSSSACEALGFFFFFNFRFII